MAKIAVPVTQPGLQRIEPVPVYSRLVAMEIIVPAGGGNENYCYTPTLGNRLILRGIDLWMHCQTTGAFLGGFVYLMFGSGVPRSPGDVALRWNHIIEQHCGIKKGQRFDYCEHVELHYSMYRRFEFDEIRFGCVIENFYNQLWTAIVLFEISEG